MNYVLMELAVISGLNLKWRGAKERQLSVHESPAWYRLGTRQEVKVIMVSNEHHSVHQRVQLHVLSGHVEGCPGIRCYGGFMEVGSAMKINGHAIGYLPRCLGP